MFGPERLHHSLYFLDLRPLPRFAHSLEILLVNTYARFPVLMRIVNGAFAVRDLLQL